MSTSAYMHVDVHVDLHMVSAVLSNEHSQQSKEKATSRGLMC